jgi:hypothetical protein
MPTTWKQFQKAIGMQIQMRAPQEMEEIELKISERYIVKISCNRNRFQSKTTLSSKTSFR